MLLTLEIFALITMIIIMFVSIWGFIILSQIFGQLRYKNYLMEKLIQVIYLQKKDNNECKDINSDDEEEYKYNDKDDIKF